MDDNQTKTDEGDSETAQKTPFQKPEGLLQLSLSNGFKTLLPKDRTEHYEEVLKFKMRPDDVVVATYPKAGTTWVQEIVWLICNDADIASANAKSIRHRYGTLEVAPEIDFLCGLRDLEKHPIGMRRFIKTHVPYEAMPNELQNKAIGKLIYVVRNPKDNCVSYYHFHRMNKHLPHPGTWKEFLTKFCDGNMTFGSWFDHVYKWWEVCQERKESMLIVSFEGLKKDLKGEVIKLATFLEKELSSEQIDSIVHRCTFKEMSKHKSSNWSEANEIGLMDFKTSKFMRKGEVGDWKNHFTVSENEAFDVMFHSRTKDWSLKFEFDPDRT